jgi:hypothetical protein
MHGHGILWYADGSVHEIELFGIHVIS